MARKWIELGAGPKKAWKGEIYASINYRSEIVVNRRAFEALDKPEAVVMMFDEDGARSTCVRQVRQRSTPIG